MADAMPAGTYNVATNGGSIQISSLLPPVPLPATTPTPVALADQPVQYSLPANTVATGNFSTPITGGSLNVAYTVTVPSTTLAIEPATGDAQLDATLYGSFDLSATIFGVPTSTTCTIGDAGNPVALHLTTANGAPWAATTGNFGLADKTFVIPAPSCGDANLQAILGILMGGTNPGDNSAQVTGNATRQPDAPGGGGSTPATTPATTTDSGSTGATTTPQATTGAPAGQAIACVVPKLKHKKLKQAKRALKKAHCRLGKVKHLKAKKAKTKKRKKTTVVVKQKTKAGKRLPKNARVGLVVTTR